VRLDRIISLGLVQPLQRVIGTSITPDSAVTSPGASPLWPIPILMYHGISNDPEPGISPYYRVKTSPAMFRRQMELLADLGYETVSLEQLLEATQRKCQDGPAHPLDKPSKHRSWVVITFDDGLRNFLTEAVPVLRQFGFTATMFLATSFVGQARRSFRPRGPSSIMSEQQNAAECLTWDEVRDLKKAGFHFGSHTVTHPNLIELSWPEVETELGNSKAEIEQKLGEPISTFAYPYAFPQADRAFTAGLRQRLAGAGYRVAVTTQIGRTRIGDDPLRLKRLPVNGADDLSLFAAKLNGAYDWLEPVQGLSKRLKQVVRRKPSLAQI